MKTGYSVADAMTTKPVMVRPDLTIKDASVVMREADVGSLLVVDEYNVLVGIITAEDFVYRVTAQGVDAATTPLEQVMTRDIVDIRPEVDVYEAVVIMHEHDVLHLPVRDESKKLLGFLTLKDVLKIEPQLFELVAEKAEMQASAPLRVAGQEGFCAECGNYANDLARVNNRLLCGYCQEY